MNHLVRNEIPQEPRIYLGCLRCAYVSRQLIDLVTHVEEKHIVKIARKPVYLLESVAVCTTTEPPMKWEDT